MPLTEHIHALRTKHQTIDAELKLEAQRPAPDPTTITKLKREKLKLKDEIERLSRDD